VVHMDVKDEATAMGTNGSVRVEDGSAAAFAEALADLRAARRPIVVTHENPDGDALGSLIAMQGILEAIGKDCEMFIDARDLPLPQEYSFFDLKNLICEPPADFRERTIVFLDCGNLARNPAQEFGARACTSSTSTTTTTTRASGRSTSSIPARRARPRSSGG
jgi:DHH family